MVSLQTALLPEAAAKRPPCLSLVVGGGVVASTATSKKRKRDGDDDDSRGEVVEDGMIELNFDAAPLPPEWQRCLDIQSGRIHYYNTRTQKRTWKDPRAEPGYRAAAPAAADDENDDAEEEDSANCAPAGLDLDLNLTFQPRRPVAQPKPPPAAAADRRTRSPPTDHHAEDSIGKEMFAAVCGRCHMLVMMCRASPACPNCKFLHLPTGRAAAAPKPEAAAAPALKLGLQLLCCRD